MKQPFWPTSIGLLCIFGIRAAWGSPESPAEIHKNAHDIFKQLIEINTTDSIGSTTVAAQAMAQRLLEAGFPAADLTASVRDVQSGTPGQAGQVGGAVRDARSGTPGQGYARAGLARNHS